MPSQTRRITHHPAGLVAAVAIALCAAGCDESRPEVGVATYPTTGKVVLADGKPLTSGVVVFVPSGEKTPPVSGTLNAEGTFTLMTDGVVAGAPAGDYKVRVELDPDAPPVGTPAKRRGGMPFPAKYSKETTSGLTATIAAEPMNELAPFVLQ
jgi:hypothetical protein